MKSSSVAPYLESVQHRHRIQPVALMPSEGTEVSLELPEPIAAFFVAESGRDIEALAHCFADDAVVCDEGRTIKGLTAIKQ
jgi:hypothetical protein